VICIPSAYLHWKVELTLTPLAGAVVNKNERDAGSVSIQTTFMNDIKQRLSDQKAVSLIYLDIRHFRHFNDSFGYQKSDELLRHIKSILIEKAPKGVKLSSMNGAAFLLAVPRVLSEQSALDMIDLIISPFKQLITFDEREVMLTFSAGFTVAAGGTSKVETLVREAQIAANYSKEKGFDCYFQYQQKMDRSQDDVISLQSELCHALKREEFSLYYQPKISLLTGDILGAEALIRWQHSERGMISPDRFIPLAELTGLIGPIGDWVLSTASLQCSY
jgi:diguanylate cyclase (GGDEF)-like protein